MALIQINYVSKALQRTVPLQVILPVDKLTPDGKLPAEKKFKTLYLLHGFLGNYTDWVSGTRIQRWAEDRDLCVVMPSGDNAFYVDRPQTGNCYGQFIGEELVEKAGSLLWYMRIAWGRISPKTTYSIAPLAKPRLKARPIAPISPSR